LKLRAWIFRPSLPTTAEVNTMRKRRLAFAVLSLLMGFPVFAQQKIDWDKAQAKLEKISQNVYMLRLLEPNGTAIGGNVAVFLDEDGVILVDCNFLQAAPKIEAAVETISDKPIKYVLNTHWHGDHTGGNAYFGKTAVIIGQDNLREKMRTGGKLFSPSPALALPAITYSREFTLHLDKGDIHAIYFPHGHTNTDSVIFFPQDHVVSTGDDFTVWSPPHFPGFDRDEDGSGSVQGQMAMTEYVMAHVPDDVKIIPGHGQLGSKKDLANQLTVLKDTVAAIQVGIDQGKRLDQLKQERVLAKWEYLNSPGRSTDKYLELVYRDLVQNRESGNRSAKSSHAE
jgi:cyclase